MGYLLSFGTTEPIPWEVAFGTSYLPGPLLLGIRWICALVFLFNFLRLIYEDSILNQRGLFTFITLTSVGYTFETAYVCILPIATIMAQRALAQPRALGSRMAPLAPVGNGGGTVYLSAGQDVTRSAGPQPPLITLALALFTIAHPASLLVVLLFWILLVPFQETCFFTGGEEPCTTVSSFNVFLHLGDWLLLIVLFFIGRIPFYLQNSLYFFAWSLAYGLFTVLHFVLEIGVAPVDDCLEYPRRECPIYSVFDFHFPRQATMLLLQVLFILVPVLILVYWGLGWGRVCCCGGY